MSKRPTSRKRNKRAETKAYRSAAKAVIRGVRSRALRTSRSHGTRSRSKGSLPLDQ